MSFKPRLGRQASAVLSALNAASPKSDSVRGVTEVIGSEYSRVTQIIGRLRRQGFVRRTNGFGPGKQGLYTITKEGRAELARWTAKKEDAA